MPYTLRKVPRRNCYTVRKKNKNQKHSVFSKCTSLAKANKQRRLLYALENPNFIPRKSKKSSKKK